MITNAIPGRDRNEPFFIVSSDVMIKLLGLAQRVAKHPASILLVGETGTGKELLANYIHRSSLRATNAFVDINCAALPEHLVESELFGFEKGAFSGADALKRGLFELADKGTVFLDEVGELDLKLQAKLLRFLDGSSYFRLGGTKKISVDVRVLAATNIDLEAATREGNFRSDLYHRLSQFQLRVPPLRERTDDIIPIAESFLAAHRPGLTLSSDAVESLLSYSWPGNVRELRNILMQASVLASECTITRANLPHEVQISVASTNTDTPLEVAPVFERITDLGEMKKQAILRALSSSKGHQENAARQLGISRRTLSRKLKQYGLGKGSLSQTPEPPLGTMAPEQEKAFRVALDMPVSLRRGTGDVLAGRLRNVSAKGIGISELPAPPALRERFTFAFVLPNVNVEMTGEGEIVWANVDGTAGLNFVSINSHTRKCLTVSSIRNAGKKDGRWPGFKVTRTRLEAAKGALGIDFSWNASRQRLVQYSRTVSGRGTRIPQCRTW